MSISSVNPANGQVLKKFEPHSDAEVERRVALAQRTFATWRADELARTLRAAVPPRAGSSKVAKPSGAGG